jgi:hypothetical protein
MFSKIRNRTLATLIAVLLISSMAASVTFLPTTSAHTPAINLPVNAYVTALPETVGVGQYALIYMWVNRVYGYFAGESYYAQLNINNYRFHNYNLTIVDSNGTIVFQKIFDTIQDTTSSQGYSWVPTTTGTYTVIFNFPSQTLTASNFDSRSAYINDTYVGTVTNCTLNVQQEQVPTIGFAPLPTQYWTRPIFGENPYWWAISSNWMGNGAAGYGGLAVSYNSGGNGEIINPTDAVGPQTGHIMWTKPLQAGGVVGGEAGVSGTSIAGDTYFEGSAYSERYANPIIVSGLLIYNPPVGFTGSSSGPTTCVDLQTGQVRWQSNNAANLPLANGVGYVPSISFAYIYDVQDGNQHGVWPTILFTSNFGEAFDAWTGFWLFNVTGVPSATGFTRVTGPSGEQLRYVITNGGNSTNPSYTLAEWNSSKMWAGTGFHAGQSGNSPSIDTSTVTYNAATNSYSYNAYYTPTYTSITQGATVNGSQTTTVYNYTAIPTAVNASVWTNDFHNRYDWNVTIPWLNTMGASTLTTSNGVVSHFAQGSNPVTILRCIYNDTMLCMNGTLPGQGATFMGSQSWTPYTYFAVSLKPGTYGNITWMKTYDPPANNITVLEAGVDPVNRVFVENLRETMNFVGYNLDTGEKMWGPTPSMNAIDYYGSPSSGSVSNTFAYGHLYTMEYGGVCYCYDTKTGDLLWTYGNGGSGNSTDSGFEVPGHYPSLINAIGNGVVYIVSAEHTIETPIYKGALTRAINATDGTEIYTLADYTTEFGTMAYAIADGYATFFNGYDQQIYVIGRGPSQTTVNAPNAAITYGQALVIRGTVTDVSAGTTQTQQAADFPNGIPVCSDASMREWMGYVYQQQGKPSNFTGVPVTINVLDSNGNYRTIGTATTDATGSYSLTWTPDIPGNFTVFANFEGTNGYWPSSSETTFNMMNAPAATATPTPTPTSVADMYFVPAIAGLFVVIIVGLAVLALLMLRKRP